MQGLGKPTRSIRLAQPNSLSRSEAAKLARRSLQGEDGRHVRSHAPRGLVASPESFSHTPAFPRHGLPGVMLQSVTLESMRVQGKPDALRTRSLASKER